MPNRLFSAVLLSTIPLLGGCAAGAAPDAPSLMPRAIESRSDAEPVVAAAPVTVDAALDAQIAARTAAFRSAAAAFESARPTLTTRIERAKGAAEGSERWIDGQGALGELQQARTATDSAMADLEELAITRASDGAAPYPALDAAIASAQSELDRQAAIEARLKSLSGG